jgi:hypothetical protein
MLGGTIAIAKRVTDIQASLEDVPQMLVSETAENRKVVFALRTYGLPTGRVKELFRKCKDELKRKGKSARYVGSEMAPAASVLLHDAGLLDGKHGCELALIAWEEHLWIGRTVAAQDVEEYVKRDMRKPVRDTRVGLLPPKLAQVLLNFGQWLVLGSLPPEERMKASKKPLTVLDPFCGTGVIPMECLLREWNVLASDMSLKAVNGTEKNLEWLRKEKKILKKDVPSTVWKQDATKPFELKKEVPDVIVTETSLGTPFDRKPPIKEATKERNDNEKLQAAFLHNIAATLPGTPIVCTWPVWYTSKGTLYLEDIWEALHKAGFQAVLPPGVEPDNPKRVSLLYRRPNQYVAREIVFLKPRRK